MAVRADNEPPGAAWRLLDRRSTAAVAIPLIGLGLLGWYVTVRQASVMSGMATGLGQVGTRMPNDMAGPAFMVMWLGMMAAMMLPAIGPVMLAHRMVVRDRGESAMPSVAFVAGYLAVWLLIGLVPLLALLAFRNLPIEAPSSRWLPMVGGAILVAAGSYQVTPWKGTCLRACRSPIGFVSRHDAKGAGGALRAGAAYGANCVGTCCALTAVLVVVGLMNLAWMAAIALVFLAEKNWRRGGGDAVVAVGGVEVTSTIGDAALVLLLSMPNHVSLQPSLVDARSDGESSMTRSNAARSLAVALAAYIVCDTLLTPPAGLEARDPAKVTGLGFAVLGLLFIGLALGIVALVLLFRGSRRGPMVAIVAAVLYLPAFLAEQAGLFSALRPPVAIQRVELVQTVVAVIVIGLGFWLLRSGIARTANS